MFRNSLFFAVCFFIASLIVISLTVFYFNAGIEKRSQLVSDLRMQQGSLTHLDATVAHLDSWITQLIYLGDSNLEGDILAEAEDLQIRLLEFEMIAARNGFLLDLSLVEEMEPLMAELSNTITELVMSNSVLEEREDFVNKYLVLSHQVATFSKEALYGKNNVIISNIKLSKLYSTYFYALFLCEVLLIFLATLIIYLRFSKRLDQSETALVELASYDPLTGLCNRRLLENTINQLAVKNKSDQKPYALFFLDLDDFKKVNDTWGHNIGDLLLKAIADRLRDYADETVVLSRLGGDEFVLMIEYSQIYDDWKKVAYQIVAIFTEEFLIKGHSVQVGCCVGVSVFSNDNKQTALDLLQQADTALYRAKGRGRNTVMFYSHEMNLKAKEDLELENEIRRVLREGGFQLHYQPRISLQGKICSAEALIRWEHSSQGSISINHLIKIAERSDLIVDLGYWVRETAMQQLSDWVGSEFSTLKLSVNISGQELLKGKVTPHLETLFRSTRVQKELLELELTENSLVEIITKGQKKFDLLQGLGVKLSIDDFGTGYSSLSYLQEFQVDVVKIDKSFIGKMMENNESKAIVRAIISMAHDLNLRVVAEGVENSAQLNVLRSLNCDEIQGYIYSPALPVEDFESFVKIFNGASFDQK